MPPEPLPTQPVASANPNLIDLVYDLLDEAYLAMEDLRLTTPVEDNAYHRYLRVLTLDPKNKEAEQGLNAIVDQYLAWAISAVNLGRYSKATGYINKARAIDENHPNIIAIETRMAAEKLADSNLFNLDPDALADRSKAIQQQLASIAQHIQASQAKVVIRAPTDADGRWIYQRLNQFTQLRVRARFELGSNPSVRLKTL